MRRRSSGRAVGCTTMARQVRERQPMLNIAAILIILVWFGLMLLGWAWPLEALTVVALMAATTAITIWLKASTSELSQKDSADSCKQQCQRGRCVHCGATTMKYHGAKPKPTSQESSNAERQTELPAEGQDGR